MASERISPQDAREHLEMKPDTMLVCAYDNHEKYRKNHISGAVSFQEFQARADLIPKDREIIFYCACANQETSARRAEEYKARGFRRVQVLDGGYAAWKEAASEVPLSR
jgi:rhodanese-related sulfurtransferase